MRTILALGLTIALSGCAATGATFKEHPAYTEPVPEATSRVIVYRLTARQYVSGAVPRLRLDGADLGQLLEKGFIARDVDPGTHKLAVDASTAPGQCNLQLELPAGETSYFVVVARGQYTAAQATGFFLMPYGSIAEMLANDAVVAASGAIESSDKQCGGGYSLVRVLPAVAQAMLSDLRESTK
jgi:hypothetical protein